MRERRCEAWFKASGCYIIGMGLNANWGLTCICGPLVTLVSEPDPSDLGRAIRQSLAGFRVDLLEGDSSWNRLRADLWAAGVRGWSGLEASSRSFSISDDGNRVTVQPRGGGEVGSCGCDPDEIGRLLLDQLSQCPLSSPLTPPRTGHSYQDKAPRADSVEPGISFEPENIPEPFGNKTSWLAIDTEDTKGVVKALRLRQAEQTCWSKGLHKGTFVAPPILGWTLVVGVRPEAGEPQFVPFLEELSRRFGEVQYFATHRVVDYHAWAKAVGGRVVRSYAWLGERGEVLQNVGHKTSEEEELGFRFIDGTTAEGDEEDAELPGEEDVMRIAGRWSLNPQEIDAYESKGAGYLGDQP
jgi:hypothetical protein